ncbi:MAG: butyrate kinase, partial [Blautia sp.]
MEKKKILVLNIGSTSTKVAIYEDRTPLFVESIRYTAEELACEDPMGFRERKIMDTLREKGYSIENLDAVAARGGLLRPIESGTYKINDRRVEDLKNARYGAHAV